MAQRVEISCINKGNRYSANERISSVGGKNPNGSRWRLSEDEAIDCIKQRKYDFFVRQAGREVNVIVARTFNGTEYLKTEADGQHSNNLLSLAECPL